MICKYIWVWFSALVDQSLIFSPLLANGEFYFGEEVLNPRLYLRISKPTQNGIVQELYWDVQKQIWRYAIIERLKTHPYSQLMVMAGPASPPTGYMDKLEVRINTMRTRQPPTVRRHFMMTSSNGNIFCVTGHLCGEFTGHRSPVNSPHKGQWRGALMFSLICVWVNGWVNNCEAGDLRRNRTLLRQCNIQTHFIEWKLYHFDANCTKVCSRECN